MRGGGCHKRMLLIVKSKFRMERVVKFECPTSPVHNSDLGLVIFINAVASSC